MSVRSYMPYLIIKVLTIRYLTISLVLNNWALVSGGMDVYFPLSFIHLNNLKLLFSNGWALYFQRIISPDSLNMPQMSAGAEAVNCNSEL